MAKLSQDFPGCKFPEKRGKSYLSTIELGRLATKKKVLPNGQASLALIIVASFQIYLSKEFCSTEWAAEKLTDDQIQYAALDAYPALMVWDVLKKLEHNGQPLFAATAVGQLVSLFVNTKRDSKRSNKIQSNC